MRQYSFFLLSKTISRNPNFQNNGFYILRIEFTMGYKTGQIFFPKGLKPPFHELSFRKSPSKNHTILFRVGSSSGSNVTRFHKSQHSRPHKDSDCITNAACKCIWTSAWVCSLSTFFNPIRIRGQFFWWWTNLWWHASLYQKCVRVAYHHPILSSRVNHI